MTDNVRNLAPQILDQINKSQKILLHCHPSPDPDSIGSALAMRYFLTSIGKQVTVIAGDSKLSNGALCLPNADKILPKNIFEITLSDFDLFIILDTSSSEQISKLKPITFPSGLKTIIIDHHTTNSLAADISLVDKTYPATGLLIFDLFSLWNIPISHEIAVCLFLAIHNDTGGFTYSITTPETFAAAEKLTKIAPDFADYLFQYDNQNDPQKVYYEGLALNSIKLYFNSHVAISQVTYSQLNALGIQKIHTEQSEIANILKSVIGWELGISFIEREPEVISISFRTRDPIRLDVSKVAVATGHGGGHPPASGATLKMPFDQALLFLLETIQKTYPELGEP
jgi:phosphoesterase RecJ-like protein